MKHLTTFVDTFGKPENAYPADGSTIKSEHPTFPEALLELLTEHGFGSYADEFIWTINPSDFLPYIRSTVANQDALPILRTSFGDIIFIVPAAEAYTFYALNLRHQEVIEIITTSIDHFFNVSLIEYGFILHYLKINLDLYWFTFEKLGSINANECYGYKKTPAQGGKDTPDNIAILKLHDFLQKQAANIREPITQFKTYD